MQSKMSFCATGDSLMVQRLPQGYNGDKVFEQLKQKRVAGEYT